MKKRLFAVLLAVLMIASLSTITAMADGTTVSGGSGLVEAINAAESGTTINIGSGTYDVGSLRIGKPVNLVADEGADVTVKGSIVYGNGSWSDGEPSSEEITWSGINLVPTSPEANNFGVCLSSRVSGYTFIISDCSFTGFEYAVCANSGAAGNVINVNDTSFADTGCAFSIQEETIKNTLTVSNVTIPDGTFGVQSFAVNDSVTSNDYFYEVDNYLNNGTPDVSLVGEGSENNKVVFNEAQLRDAVNSATGNSATNIYIAADIELTSGINVTGKKINVYGNRNTISYERSGSFDGVFGNSINAATSGTEITVTDLTIENTSDNAEGYASVVGVYNDSTTASVTYTNCTFVNLGAAAYLNPVTSGSGQSLTITGCDYVGTLYEYGADSSTSVKPSVTIEDNKITNVVYVGETAYFSLQDAVNDAADNSTIVLAPGTYSGNVFIANKSITIEGANAGVAGTAASRGAESVITGKITVSSNNENDSFVFDGLKFTGDGTITTGKSADNKGIDLTVTNCVADNVNGTFVTVGGVTGTANDRSELNGTITITNNKVTNVDDTNASAFNLWYASEHVITCNYVENVNFNAVNLDQTVGNVTFSDNTIKSVGEYGLQLATSITGGMIEITDNTFEYVKSDKSAVYISPNGDQPVAVDSTFVVRDNDIYGEGVEKAIDFSNATFENAVVTASGNTLNDAPVSITFGESSSVFAVVYKASDDSIISIRNYTSGTIYLPNYSDTSDYRFVGWRSSVDGKVYSGEYELKTDVTFTQVWSQIVNVGPTYDIDLIVGEGGEAKTNLSNASAGSTITVTVTPDEGYELDYITVGGERITGTSFTMPDHDVTVRVYFTDGTVAFADVSRTDWFYNYVQYVVSNGLMEGTSATTFEPNANMSRAMVWAILARIDGETVTGANWVETARAWAMSNGVSDGENANGNVTREQLATMLYRFAGEPTVTGSLSAFTDAVSDWAVDGMTWAVANGIVTGMTDTTIVPQGTATRAQAAAMLMRFVEL